MRILESFLERYNELKRGIINLQIVFFHVNIHNMKSIKNKLKILGILIFIIVIFLGYRNSWHFEKTVPIEEYSISIIGDWTGSVGETLSYREDGILKIYNEERGTDEPEALIRNWEIKEEALYTYGDDVVLGALVGQKIKVINSKKLIIESNGINGEIFTQHYTKKN